MTERFRRLTQRQMIRVLGERPPRVILPPEGEAESTFLPKDSPARLFNVDPGNIVGAHLALLMQALHPAVAAGFVEHSNFRADPFGRMLRTATFIREVTFGSEPMAMRRIAQVRKLHSSVRGANSLGIEYDAEDPKLLEWVFLCFVYGFVWGYYAFGQENVTVGVLDAFVRDMGRVGMAFDIPSVPATLEGLERRIDTLAPGIDPTAQSRELIAYLRTPPALGRIGRVENRLVMLAAGSLFPGSLQRQARAVGIPTGTQRVARTVTKTMLKLVRWSFGVDPNLNETDLCLVSVR